MVSVIDVPKSMEVIEISSEEDSWSLRLETSNSSDLHYQPKGWNRKRKREVLVGAKGSRDTGSASSSVKKNVNM